MSQIFAKCHNFSNLWYKATFTFYVWLWLGTALNYLTGLCRRNLSSCKSATFHSLGNLSIHTNSDCNKKLGCANTSYLNILIPWHCNSKHPNNYLLVCWVGVTRVSDEEAFEGNFQRLLYTILKQIGGEGQDKEDEGHAARKDAVAQACLPTNWCAPPIPDSNVGLVTRTPLAAATRRRSPEVDPTSVSVMQSFI